MSCIACFIDNNNQKKLKKNCFGLDRFELKLKKYKESFLENIKKLKSISECDCEFRNNNSEYVQWTDSFLEETLNNISVIEDTFDDIISIYISYISENTKIATDKIWSFLQQNDLLNETESGFTYSTIYFRARIYDKTFNKSDINNFLHIPFNKRGLVGNQRFSVSGQPMLYLGKSIYGIKKELSTPINNLAISAFIPYYKDFYSKKYFTIKNTLFDTIAKTLPEIAKDHEIDYDDSFLTPNRNSIKKDIKKSIFSQILTFPVEKKSSFISEYVLPQMTTTALLENNFNGIVFPSTKDFSELKNYNIRSDHESNFAIFVNYSESNQYDDELLKNLLHFTLNGKEEFNHSVYEILNKFELVFELNRKSNYHNFIAPLISLRLQVEYLEKSKIDGIEYYETSYGKIELEFYSKVADFYLSIIK
ncbi:hypothetical protein [uncultured Dokdonia sp.]|uniref:hypothetical protein n=1 Tax=uncultured Dokdonia sp. TaxID=575653 RepID=UPI002618D221|nr:hypothetical protein [uncultured Dokdonia sp.]